MRFPLVRQGNDETPIAWWEWLFAPIMMPLFFLILLVLAVVSVPGEFIYRLLQKREEKKLRPRLESAGRFMTWGKVEMKLREGEGTLIIEHRSPKGPIREWWTEDNLIDSAPVTLPTSLATVPEEGLPEPLLNYSKECAEKYLDVVTGIANLTEVPVLLGARFDPRKYVVVDLGGGLMTAILLATNRNLAEKYPQAKIATLVAWSDVPILAAGDAESVFLNTAKA